ncbi:outer membrane beta-barrel protein [Pseudomonadota bacterium]
MNKFKLYTLLIGMAAAVGLSISESGWAQYTYGVSPAPHTRNAVTPAIDIDEAEVGFYPSISIVATRHKNSQRINGIENSDTVISVVPNFGFFGRVGGEVGRHPFYVLYQPTFDGYKNFTNNDSISHSLQAGWLLDFTERFDVDLRGNYNTGVEERGASGTPAIQSIEPNDVTTWGLGAQATYGLGDSMFSLGGGAYHSETRYDNNGQKFRDRDEDTLNGTLNYNIGPRTRTYLVVRNGDIDYVTNASKSDSTQISYSVGVNWRATDITNVSAEIGRLDKKYDDPAVADYSDTTYRAAVGWSGLPRTNVIFNASRLIEESPEIISNYFVSSLYGVSASYAFTNRFRISGHANKINDDFDDGREDDIEDYSIGVNYNWLRWLSIFARYGVTSRDSNLPEAIWDDEYISIGVTASAGSN